MSSAAAPFVPKAGEFPPLLSTYFIKLWVASGLPVSMRQSRVGHGNRLCCVAPWLPESYNSPPSKAANGHAARSSSRNDLMLPDGDDLLGMTAHTPGELAQVSTQALRPKPTDVCAKSSADSQDGSCLINLLATELYWILAGAEQQGSLEEHGHQWRRRSSAEHQGRRQPFSPKCSASWRANITVQVYYFLL